MDSGEKIKQQQSSLISNVWQRQYREDTWTTKNMGIQGRIMEFIRELIGERWIKVRVGGYISQSKQTDLRIIQGGVLSVTLFLVSINGILEELGNGVNGSFFA